MSEVHSKEATTTTTFSHGSDSTDSDFIQEHIESFFPPADSKEEVIEENLEENIGEEEGDDDGIPDDVPDEIGDVIEELEFSDMEEGEYASGPVVSVISGEVDADDAEMILDLLLYSDEDMENRVANYNDLDTPQTVGLATDLIKLIPWTGFEMDETGEIPKEITYSDVIGGIIVDLIGGFTEFVTTVVGTLHEGVLALAGFIADMGEIVVEWGMRVIDAIGEAFSAVRDAVSEVGELMSALADWIVSHVSSLFSSVWDTVISGLESWAEGIQEAMEDFFEELAEWDEMDGSESMEDTMEAGSALMLSFIGQQDRASSVMDVMERIMRFIEPFQQYISPFGIAGVIGNIFEGDLSGGEGIFNQFKDIVGGATESILTELINVFIDLSTFLGFNDISIDTSIWDNPSFEALSNFLEETGHLTGELSIIINAFIEADWDEISDSFLIIVQSALSVVAMYMVFAFAQGITLSPIISLVLESISLALSWVSGILGNIFLSIISVFMTEFFGFLGFLMGPGPKQALIIIIQQIVAPFSILTYAEI